MPALPLAFLGIWAQALGGGALMCGSVCCLPWKGWQGLPGGCSPPAEPLLTSPRPAVYTQQIHPPTSLAGVKSYSPLSWPVLLCAGMCVPVHRHTHTHTCGVHTSPHHPFFTPSSSTSYSQPHLYPVQGSHAHSPAILTNITRPCHLTQTLTQGPHLKRRLSGPGTHSLWHTHMGTYTCAYM